VKQHRYFEQLIVGLVTFLRLSCGTCSEYCYTQTTNCIEMGLASNRL